MAVDLEKSREYFSKDTFATGNGIYIVSVDENTAIVECKVRDDHYNARGTVQGGLIFTLADFAFGVVSNTGERKVTSQNITITFMRPPLGGTLTAIAKIINESKSMMLVEVEVRGEGNKLIAKAHANGFKVKE
jgi:acyl-CoA thioesterase